MTEKKVVEEMRLLIKNLQRENKNLKKENRQLQTEQEHYKDLCKNLSEWLDQLGRGSIQLFSEVKNQLESIQQKINRFENDSPLSFLELYD